MSEGKVKSAKVKVYPAPEGTGGQNEQFFVYVYDVFNKSFAGGKSFANVERAVSFQRHEQERIYTEQEADPELFDLPFLSSDPDLLDRVARDAAYRAHLERELTGDARARARRR